jgi:hypothetical protein
MNVNHSSVIIKRRHYRYDGYSLIIDKHHTTMVQFCYFYFHDINVSNVASFPNSFETIKEASQSLKKEYPIIRSEGKDYFVWIPHTARVCSIGEDGRISMEESFPVGHITHTEPELKIELLSKMESSTSVVFTCILFPVDNKKLINQIQTADNTGQKPFRKSNWFVARSVMDIWNYLIYGSIYDPRAHQSIKKRFKCQQCAYAWWTYCNYYYRNTQKEIFSILRDEIAFSIVNDLESSGVWKHGFWSDAMETHARFQLDGIHLLISQYEIDGNRVWLENAKNALIYVINDMTDRFSDGSIWFLHDSIEEKRNHKFYSTIFGKNRNNSLCINTHIQALSVLRRMMQHDDNHVYYSSYQLGIQALRKIFEHKPADIFYKIITKLLILPGNSNKSNIYIFRILHAVLVRLAKRSYWSIKARYPRIILPGGFIERDLNLSMISDRYHVINVKDLLTLYQISRHEWLIPYIKNGVNFLIRYVKQKTLNNLLDKSLYYIEYPDILKMFDELIEPVPYQLIVEAEDQILSVTNAFSLDLYASIDICKNHNHIVEAH